MSNVRSKIGTPILDDFSDSSGTPIVINQTTGDAYVLLANNSISGLNSSSMVFTQSGTGAVARTAQGKMRESVSVKDFGAVGDGVTSDTSSIQAAINSGALNIYLPTRDGEEYVIDANITVPRGVTLYGDSADKGGILVKTSLADIVYITMTGYTQIKDLDIHGNDATKGTLVEATGGIYTFTGHIRYVNTRFSLAKIGLKINSIFDLTSIDCQFLSCQVGLDASPLTNGGDNGYINVLTFIGGYFYANADYHFFANPAIRISNISFSGTIFDPGPSIAKVYLYSANPVIFMNSYFEGNSTVPAILSSLSTISVTDCYINGTGGIKADSGTAGTLRLEKTRIGGSTDIIDYPSSNHKVRLRDITLPSSGNIFSITNRTSRYWDNATVNGILYDIWNVDALHTPILSGAGTAGTPTYSAQTMQYTVVGKQCHFSGRVSITAIGGMVGALRISLPHTSIDTSNTFYICGLRTSGVTPSAGKTYFYGHIASNSNLMELYQDGNAAGGTPILDTNIAASTGFLFSGSYKIA